MIYLTSESAAAEQEEGFDTVDANRQLGLPDDAREYSSVLNILKDLDIKSIQLIVRSIATCSLSCHKDSTCCLCMSFV
jgi:GTP cyclohydrolase II